MITTFMLSRKKHAGGRGNGASNRSGKLSLRAFWLMCGLVISLSFLLSACSNPFVQPVQGGGPTSITPSPTQALASPTPSVTPRVITLHVSSNCPSYVVSTNWDKVLNTNPAVNKVQLVNYGSLEGAGSMEAVVGVGYVTPDAKLDVYVFDNLTSSKPTVTFKVPGLIDGDAQVSPTGTLMTAEIGLKGVASKERNLFKEYQWNGSSFAQVLFPYIYPDMTHYQAEQDNTLFTTEVAANQKADLWKTSGTDEAGHLALSIFRWTSVTQSVLKFDSAADTIIVQTNNTGPGGGGFIATLHHLDGNTHNILEITSVTPLDTNINLSSPAAGTQVKSPVNVAGTAQGGTNLLGEVVIYDDSYVQAGTSGPIASTGTGYTSFTHLIPYTLNASGVQEGVVVLMTTTQNNIALTNQIEMVKVFLAA